MKHHSVSAAVLGALAVFAVASPAMAAKTAHTMVGAGEVKNLTEENLIIKTDQHDYALYAGEGGIDLRWHYARN